MFSATDDPIRRPVQRPIERIVLCYPVQADHIGQIQRAAGDGVEVVDAGQEHIARELPTADIFCGHAKVPVPWGQVVRQGRLQWIQSSAAGLDHCLVPEVVQSPILVSGASGLFARQVAEQTLALLLGLLRRMNQFFAAQQRHEFVRRPTDDLQGKTVGIVGLGGNGRMIARYLSSMGVRIVATDYFPQDKPAEVDALWPSDGLTKLLRQSQIVIVAVPLTAETHHLIAREEFAQMRPGSYLINVARGPVVCEADLVAALESGHLAGAGLDVTEHEPLDPQSPLWDRPDVIVTPHVGAQAANRVDLTTHLFCENLARYRRGERLRNEVDKRLGFPRPECRWEPESLPTGTTAGT